MIGILIGLLLSWLLLYFLEKKSLLALGFLPIRKRLGQFFIGFVFLSVLCIGVQYLESFLKSSNWILNKNITTEIILISFYWDVKSVFTEELIYRGALLYILIQKIGAKRSILISATAFGIYHWFSYGVLGNPMAMIFVFLGTSLMGYGWALAFAKTKSIMFPFGMHLGWNFTYNTIFSKGPLGDLLLISQGGTDLEGWTSLLNFLTGLVLVPIIVILCVHLFVKSKQ